MIICMRDGILKNLPKRRPRSRDERLVQCRLLAEIHAEMLEAFERAKEQGAEASWQSFIEAACLAFLKDN